MSDIGDMIGAGLNMIAVMVCVGVVLVGVAAFFGGAAWTNWNEEHDVCSEMCGEAQTKKIEGECHCQTATGWIKPEVAQ